VLFFIFVINKQLLLFLITMGQISWHRLN